MSSHPAYPDAFAGPAIERLNDHEVPRRFVIDVKGSVVRALISYGRHARWRIWKRGAEIVGEHEIVGSLRVSRVR